MGVTRLEFLRVARRVSFSSAGEVVGRSVNVLLPFAILYVHSVDILTDAFFLALAIAFFVQGSVGNIVSSVQVIEFVKDRGPRSLRRFSLWAVGGGLIAGMLAFWFSLSVMGSLATVLVACSVALSAAAGLLAAPAAAVLNADHRYLWPGLTWVLRIGPVIAYVIWSPTAPSLHWLLAGIALADLLRAIVLHKLSRGRLNFGSDHQPLRFPVDALYLILGGIVAGMTPLFARWIAALGGGGNVSIFDAADRAYGAVASLATIGVGNVILVYLSRLNIEGDRARAWRWILGAGTIWGLLWTGVAILIWLVFPLGAQLFPAQTEQTFSDIRDTFLALSVGFPAFVLGLIYSRRILTLGLARNLLPMAIIGLVCSVSMGFLLFEHLGTAGIALGVAIGQYLVLGLMIRCVWAIRDNANLNSL